MKYNKTNSGVILSFLFVSFFVFPLFASAQGQQAFPPGGIDAMAVSQPEDRGFGRGDSLDGLGDDGDGGGTADAGGSQGGQQAFPAGGADGAASGGRVANPAEGFGDGKTSADVSFLTRLPFVGEPGSFDELINALFILALVLGALLAVVKLVIAGATYMLSDVVTKKQDALAGIRGAVLGLLLIMSTTLLLTQINPDITDMESLQNRFDIEVPDTDDYDKGIIESMCEDETCIKIECQDDTDVNECKQKCVESANNYGADNVHVNYRTGLCVIRTQSEEDLKQACESDLVGGTYIKITGQRSYCQSSDDTSNTNTVDNPEDVEEFVEEKEKYSKLVELDTGYYNRELDDEFKENLLDDCRNLHFGNHVEFFELKEDGRVAATCFGGSN